MYFYLKRSTIISANNRFEFDLLNELLLEILQSHDTVKLITYRID